MTTNYEKWVYIGIGGGVFLRLKLSQRAAKQTT